MIRFSDGHINVYDASTHAEIISAYDSEIERSEMKVLSLAGSKSSYSATVLNVLYDKKRPEELPIKLYTPNRYFYQTILRRMDKKSIKSAVLNFPEIKHDATIGLAAGDDHDAAKWEIVIGTSGGTETLIRPCNKCNFLARKFHSKAQYNQWASQGVEISFDDGLIKVTCEYSGEEIISYRSSSVKKRNIKHLLVSTSNGASGIWTITELKYFKSRSRRDMPSSTIINSDNYEHHYNYDPDYLYEYNSATTTTATAIVNDNDNSTSMMNDFEMGFQQYDDEEDEEEFEDFDGFSVRIDETNPFRGINQITSGFSKWTDRFLSNCKGQQKNQHQAKRMERWNRRLQDHLSAYFTVHHD